MKKCTNCLEEKDLTCFAFKSKKRNTLSSHCKDCHNRYSKKHYQANKEMYIQKAARSEVRLRAWYAEIKKNLCCVRCGEDDIACLDFHHSDPEQKDFNVSRGVGSHGSRKLILTEMEKCAVLCSNCHRKLHYYGE